MGIFETMFFMVPFEAIFCINVGPNIIQKELDYNLLEIQGVKNFV